MIDTLYIGGVKYMVVPLPEPRPVLWQIISGQDYNPPCPAVAILKEDPHAKFDRQWQYFVRAINPGMSIHHVSALYGSDKAFFNKTGFPGRRNWLTGECADCPDPNADKVRSCLLNVVTGVEEGSFLNVTTFDSRFPPPLKDGFEYPGRVEDINPDAYAFTPEHNPEMFVTANIIQPDGEVVPFPNGAVYDWTCDNTPRSFLPLISNPEWGSVLVHLSKLRRIPDDDPVPSPYRRR